MLKKSLKYFLIAFVNALILTLMLALWTDKVEMALNLFVRPFEFLKIIGITLVSLIGMRLLVGYLNRQKVSILPKRKLLYASILTFALSAYFYITYTANIYNCTFDATRQSLARKVKDADLLAFGTTAENLTFEEYAIVKKLILFPETLPRTATQISYIYTFDGFLPDYLFRLSYDVPMNTKVEELAFEEGTSYQKRTVETEGDYQRVTYEEGKW